MDMTARQDLSSSPVWRSLASSPLFLIFVATLPLFLFAVGMAGVSAVDRFRALEGDLGDLARALLISVDKEIDFGVRLANTLARSDAIASDDIQGFDAEARRIADNQDYVTVIALSDPTMNDYLANTTLPMGVRAPVGGGAATRTQDVLKAGKTIVYGIRPSGPTEPRPIVVVSAPVFRDGKVSRVVHVGVAVEAFANVFDTMSPKWTGMVIDDQFRIVARSRDSGQVVGQMPTDDLVDNIRTGDTAIVRAESPEGATIYRAHARSADSGWSVVLSLPSHELEAPIWRFLVLVGVLGLAAVGSGGTVAYRVARRTRAKEAETERFLESELVRRTAALRESEKLFRGAFENTGVGISIISDDRMTIRRFNQALCAMLGYSEAELLSMHLNEIAHPDDDPKKTRLRYMTFDKTATQTAIRRFICKDGQVIHVIASYSMVYDESGAPLHTVSLYQDITEQVRAQESLRNSEEKFRNLIDVSIQGVLIHRNFQPLFVNQAYANIFGFESLRDVIAAGSALDHFAEGERERISRRAASRLANDQVPGIYEVQGIHRDGHLIWLDVRAKRINWDGSPAILRTVVDISERKQIEQQLRQVQKMDAVGQLTGGLAHDFNNLMSVIMINGQLLADRLTGDPLLLERIEAVLKATQRGAELTKRLLAFSRQQVLEPEVVDPDTVIAEMGGLLRRTIDESIRIDIVKSRDLWPTRIDRTQFESALLNLALNARDAMPEGGVLTIETANVELDAAYAAANSDVDPGPYVLVAVSDSGVGMAPAVAQRAFEPFFTTKEVGAGTGLGLSMIYGFVTQSDGHIKIYSEEGRGTTVKMYFPRTGAAGAAATAPGKAEAGKVSRGKERILVVEDQADVRASLVYLLGGLGYRVLEAENGAAGMGIVEKNPDIDLILSDVIMPGRIDGPTLAKAVRERYPVVKVLLMSGYTQRAVSGQGRLGDGDDVITKPFHNVDLAKKIRAVLDG